MTRTKKLRFELDVGSMAAMFKAMSDPTRQRILILLEQRPRTVNEIVSEFSLAQPTISRHLAVLKTAGLVEAERDGQHVRYSLGTSALKDTCRSFFSQFSCCAPFIRRDD